MKKGLGCVGVFVLGAVLAVGCGGPVQEDGTGTQTPGEGGSGASAMTPEPALAPGEPEVQGTPGGEVGEQAVCCFVKCGGVDWAGPYRNVVYNNCPNYGKYSCKQRGLPYEGNAWKKC